LSKIEQQIRHFNEVADIYYTARQNPNTQYYKELLWAHFFKGKEYLKEIQTVLEPMCGFLEGRQVLSKVLGIDADYEGFDYSENVVNTVIRDFPGVNIKQADMTAFKPDKQYDLVILIGGLHHLPDYFEQNIETIRTCLNPGGYFINFEPTHSNFFIKGIRDYIYNKNRIFDAETERDFDLDEYNNAITGRGFALKDQIHAGLLAYVLYYNPDAFPFLNVGSKTLVDSCFSLDKIFFRNFFGKTFSFATLSLFQREG
jgi:SAM-dependent methyltransferase